jgi:serine/threonine protein kinase
MALFTKVDCIRVYSFQRYSNIFIGLIIGRAPIEYIHKSAFFAYQYENCEVAVKMLPLHLEDHCRDDFLLEIETMKRIGYHANLTNILGCITKTSPICLCVEYARNGDLVQYLRKRKYSTNPIVVSCD